MKPSFSNLRIGTDVWLRANAIILTSATEIAPRAIIAAGRIVHKNMPSNAIVAGDSGKIIGKCDIK